MENTDLWFLIIGADFLRCSMDSAVKAFAFVLREPL